MVIKDQKLPQSFFIMVHMTINKAASDLAGHSGSQILPLYSGGKKPHYMKFEKI